MYLAKCLYELLQAFIDEPSNPDVNEPTELPDLLNHIINGYKEFCNQTLICV